MAAGLGTRRFHRLVFGDSPPPTRGARTLIARLEADASASDEAASPWPRAPLWLPEPPLEPLRSFLADAELPVPSSTLSLPEEGVDLLEDVGDRNLLTLPPAARSEWTRKACTLLPRLQALRADAETVPAFGRPYDEALVASKAWKLIHWTIPMLLGRAATNEEVDATERLFAHVATLAHTAPLRLAHRDFKAENLHLCEAPDGRSRLVMIDVQGAFLAPPEYDLACLLYDLQADHDEAFVQEALDATRSTLPDAPDAATFAERFDALALARLCKDVSHVVHAGVARGDLRRWHEIPHGLELIERIALRRADSFPGTPKLARVASELRRTVQSADGGNASAQAGTATANGRGGEGS